MKKTTQLLAFMLLLSSLLFGSSNSDSSTTEYKLLNNVQLANTQKNNIENMGRILKLNLDDKESFNSSKKLFSRVLNGLVLKDKSSELQGTELRKIYMKLTKLQRLWNSEHMNLKMAFSNKKSRLKAINTIDKMNFYMKGIVSVYNKSYARYKKHEKASSLFAMK